MAESAKILIVDDDATVRFALGETLRDAGFAVVECDDGADVIDVINREKPSLAVLDVRMPRRSGWETLGEIRGLGLSLPVLMLTGVSDVPSRIRGLEAGADDYLLKPCDHSEFLARVRVLLRRSKPKTGPARLRFGDVIVDLRRVTCRRGAEDIHLTRKDYELLEFLARRRGEPSSRGQILGHIWGMADTVNSHTLDTHIWRLRKKLGLRPDGTDWIQNIPGVGYLIQCEIEDIPAAG